MTYGSRVLKEKELRNLSHNYRMIGRSLGAGNQPKEVYGITIDEDKILPVPDGENPMSPDEVLTLLSVAKLKTPNLDASIYNAGLASALGSLMIRARYAEVISEDRKFTEEELVTVSDQARGLHQGVGDVVDGLPASPDYNSTDIVKRMDKIARVLYDLRTRPNLG